MNRPARPQGPPEVIRTGLGHGLERVSVGGPGGPWSAQQVLKAWSRAEDPPPGPGAEPRLPVPPDAAPAAGVSAGADAGAVGGGERRPWDRSSDRSLVEAFSAALGACPFRAAFLELPPLTADTADRPFEAVLVEAPALQDGWAEPEVFADALAAAAPGEVASFPNLGGDALLVVPRPGPEGRAGAHLLAFLRAASSPRRGALWRAVGRGALARLGGAPLWVSTSGLGVAWLHVRLEGRPKYYTHEPYRHAP